MNEVVTLVQQITGVCMIEESNEQVILRLNCFDETEWNKWLEMHCELSATSWNVYKTYPNPKGINFESAASATTTNDPIAHRAVVGRLILGKYKITSVKDIIAVAMCFVSNFSR